MRDIEEIRGRIQERKGFHSQIRQREKKLSFFNFLYFLTIVSLIAGGLYMGYLINEKEHYVDTDKMISTVQSKLNEWHLDRFVAWLPFENWFSDPSKAVSQAVSYVAYKDDYFFSDSNQAVAIAPGVVIHCSEQESGKLVIIKQDNGILATYGALQDVQCHENDRILKGSVLGTYDEAVFLQFHLNSEKISYEEAFSMEN